MKNYLQFIVLIIIVLPIVFRCSKNDTGNNDIKKILDTIPRLSKTALSGCFLKNADTVPPRFINFNGKDTLFTELRSDTLIIHAILHRNCNSNPIDSLVMNDPNVNIYVKDQHSPNAWCDCQFGFNYYYTGFATAHGIYLYCKEYSKVDFALWDSLFTPRLVQ
jgi:hypothetical protein